LPPTRPSVARGVRDLPPFRRGQAPARDGAGGASRDLHAHRMRARRALRDRANGRRFCQSYRGHIDGQRLAAEHDAMGGAGVRHAPAQELARRGDRAQPGPARGALVLAAGLRRLRFRRGDAARAQALHPHRGGAVRRQRNAAGGRLRVGAGRRASAAGDAGARIGCGRPSGVSGWHRFSSSPRRAKIFSTCFLPRRQRSLILREQGGAVRKVGLRLVAFAALSAGAALAGGRADAAAAAPRAIATDFALAEPAQFIYLPYGWAGAGWYWCGYGTYAGVGWGGSYGWNGWVVPRHYRAARVAHPYRFWP